MKNNKTKLRLIINGISKELKESIAIKDIYNKIKIIIQLKKITDLSYMLFFNPCHINSVNRFCFYQKFKVRKLVSTRYDLN